MMSKLFQPIQEGHDPLNRVVFLCQDANGFYVYKPANGFRSRHFTNDSDADCTACFEGQVNNGHVHASYGDGESPADGEEYPLVDDEAVSPVVKKAAAKKPAAKKTVKK